MAIKRIVPNINTQEPDLCREFYEKFLGLRVAMDMGWIATYVSPTNPTAQVSLIRAEKDEPLHATISIEVGDVDAVHAQAVAAGLPIVYPLRDEPWGVRRFWVKDPNGVVINVLSHGSASVDRP